MGLVSRLRRGRGRGRRRLIAERASLVTFAVVAAGLPGCILGGLLSDRFGRTLTTAGLMAASGLCALLPASSTPARPGPSSSSR